MTASQSVKNINQSFWRCTEAPHVIIRQTDNSAQSYKRHSHHEFSLGIIKSGVTCLSIDNRNIVLNAGDAILIAPDKAHSCNPVHGQPRSYYMLYLERSWCCAILSDCYQYSVKDFSCRPDILQGKITRDLQHLVASLMVQSCPELVEQLNGMLTELIRAHCVPVAKDISPDHLALKVKGCLADNITDAFPIRQIALNFGYAPETVIRSFKRSFGLTPKSYVNNYRIEQAKRLLQQGMNIVDVAQEVGYSDQSQLHRAFVRYTAATPGQYQQTRSIFDNK